MRKSEARANIGEKNYHFSILVKISTPMDIKVTPVELGGKFLIKAQMISATLTL